MHIELSISRKAECGLPKSFFRNVARETLRLSAILKEDRAISLGVALVSSDEIRELNRLYRGKNRETDILSFGEFRRKADIGREIGDVFLGDLVLSPEFISKAASEDGVSLEREMAFIFSHGILHLLGFRHSPAMFSIQDMVAERYS